ncbi:ImmA/IrrE family metallo-endopeptidase [Shewanella sp. SP1S2-4]|uniref:ImmA/IrrE family metallo-endopeptidase n=1 Tax=Shewanella sp. SP1S2-4 TaxID=3063537 RepID=UPI002891840C|nr:ImmA/IrrE family metallo-endopeptidase [Shewanella sp. SP1S2-4]MDT3320732.1 ImmA/IrrE family metallo-endopeptidase [Shewanella sp. SP1S2-4]
MMSDKKLTLNNLNRVDSATSFLKMVFDVKEINDVELPINLEHIVGKIKNVNYSNSLSFEDWDKSGFIQVIRNKNDELSNVNIWVNPSECSVRQRFTLAHELGHLIFDVVPNLADPSREELIVEKLHRDGSSSFKETRANKFAAQLLMPKELINREVNKLVEQLKKETKKATVNEVLSKLAPRFDVSEQSLEIRLRSLGYIR